MLEEQSSLTKMATIRAAEVHYKVVVIFKRNILEKISNKPLIDK